MKTETTLLTERLATAQEQQAALKQQLSEVQRDLARVEADIERYRMALDVLSSLGGKTGKAAKAARDSLPASTDGGSGKRSLADMVLEQVVAKPNGLTTGEIVAAVQRLSKDAQYGSIVAVISRMVNKTGALRRDGGRVFAAK